MATKNQDEKKTLNVELPEDKADGVYVNLAIIAHSPTEFVLDFVNIMPGMQSAKIKSRIITNPIHAKRLFRALEDNIKRFENSFGPIEDGENIDFPITNLGGNIQA